MDNSAKLPFLKVSGTHYEIGRKIGAHFRQSIQQVFSTDKRITQLLHWDKINPNRVTKAEELTQQHFPYYLEEIRGIAQGADLLYRDVLTLNFMHLPPVVHDDCSTLMFCEKNHIILGHNEDHILGLGRAAYLVQCNYTTSDVSLFSFCYPGCIPGLSFGFNNHGIVVACNYAPDPNLIVGIPRLILGRWVLEAPSITEAIARAQAYPPRAGGVTYNIASVRDKTAVVLETTGTHGNVQFVKDRFFHTNHYLAHQFSHIPIPPQSQSSTLQRYTRGMQLLPNAQKSVVEALRIMQDPEIFLDPYTFPSGNTFYSICTAIFEIGKGVVLKIYARGQYRETPFCISLTDLQTN